MFVKGDNSKKKSDMPYGPRPHIIVEKKGSMVTAQVDGVLVARNSFLFKSVPVAAEENTTTETRKDPADVTSTPDTADALMQPYNDDCNCSKRVFNNLSSFECEHLEFGEDFNLNQNVTKDKREETVPLTLNC